MNISGQADIRLIWTLENCPHLQTCFSFRFNHPPPFFHDVFPGAFDSPRPAVGNHLEAGFDKTSTVELNYKLRFFLVFVEHFYVFRTFVSSYIYSKGTHTKGGKNWAISFAAWTTLSFQTPASSSSVHKTSMNVVVAKILGSRTIFSNSSGTSPSIFHLSWTITNGLNKTCCDSHAAEITRPKNYCMERQLSFYRPVPHGRSSKVPISHGQPVYGHWRQFTVPSQKSLSQEFKSWLRPRRVLTISVMVAGASTKGKGGLPIDRERITRTPVTHDFRFCC